MIKCKNVLTYFIDKNIHLNGYCAMWIDVMPDKLSYYNKYNLLKGDKP